MDWLEKTINRELREFIIEITKGECLDPSLVSELLQNSIVIVKNHKNKFRKLPPSDQRCLARLLKDKQFCQCLNSSQQGHPQQLCGIHLKSGLTYGIITDNIPVKYKYLDKEINKPEIQKPEEEITKNSHKINDQWDLSLYPSHSNNLFPIKIGVAITLKIG